MIQNVASNRMFLRHCPISDDKIFDPTTEGEEEGARSLVAHPSHGLLLQDMNTSPW